MHNLKFSSFQSNLTKSPCNKELTSYQLAMCAYNDMLAFNVVQSSNMSINSMYSSYTMWTIFE